VQSFKRSVETVDRLLTKNAGTIDTMITSYGTAGKALPELVRRMTAVTDSLVVVTSSLQRNDNTIGGLMQDRALLDRLEKTVKDLDELVTDVKAHPKKYLKVSIF
jgi:phospholipid/cholesterol/gamma-HCH transport system substrate-binding protein